MIRVTLGDVCEKASSNIAQKDLNTNEGEYPIYGAGGHIKNVDFYHRDKPYIAIVKDGAGIGRTMLLPEKSSVIGTMQYILLKEDSKVDLHYLYYAIVHMNLGKYFSGATIPHIYFKDYQKEPLNLPDMCEQQQIATIFEKLDVLTAKRSEQLKNLDELVKSRFMELFGDPVSNPMGWIRKTLQQLVTVEPQNGLYKPQSDYVQDKSGVPILRIDAFYNGKVTSFENLKRLVCSDTEKERYLLKENDIVINRVNSIEYLGKCAHISGMLEDTVFESNMMRFHLDEEQTDAVFITHLLCSKYIYNQILRTAKKAVNQASINQKDVLGFEVYVPPLELQQQFAAFVAEVDKSKLAVQKGLQELEILKKSLMQQYFG